MEYTGENSKCIKRDDDAPNNQLATFASLISFTDSDHDSGWRTDSETNLKEPRCSLAENVDSSDSVSSSSSISSSGVLFQINPQILTNYCKSSASPKLMGDIKTFYESDKVDVSNEFFFKLEESFSKSPGSTAQVSDVTHESFLPNISLKQSPPIQVMERPGDFDPHRIPPSVFAIPSTPMEWSETSNDSLFSIRIGNNNSSRDQVSRISGDLYRSGELSKSGEILEYGESYQSGELYNSPGLIRAGELITSFDQASAATKGVEPKKNSDAVKSMGVEKNFGATGVAYESTNKFHNAGINHLYKANLKEPQDSYNANCQTDGSPTRTLPLAFPTKKSARPLCHCSNCNSNFCCCKWPSCSCAVVNGSAVTASQPAQGAIASVQPGQAAAVSAQPGQAAAVSAQPGRAATVSPTWSSCLCKCQTWSTAAVSAQPGRAAAISAQPGQAAAASARRS
ncbi:uncharacterized protein Fot_15860 [Forsythia ovata]|uniref:Uncharacterized protein n=1 Tax=Forsythia ovata TaxID=205694 RepID=A0ABD1WAD2_9LAMI